ncbi:AAA family ATPase [Agrococcus jenensis]|uniref:Nuclease SbcCD subunit C n=1 Tax=Agrococcus jenensis TaxID=46353 RepID=A0A3N2ANN1_9MICO|nr:AAA family ATPase [Agrococcus jenensis]ROR64670.1 exonuclease SbcC [Agrococcus jenensis]
MRILRLALEAFGPFRDRFEVDFSSFEGDGVYLIAGPTGAGKSTVLDAISFALYGSAPRYDERAHLRSDLAGPGSPTVVELDVQLGDRVLRVLRSPEYERPKARGTGTTREPARATLFERTADGWEAIATTTKEVGHEVGRLVGLTKQEFLQVILLAQGGFAEFLRATSDERKALLLRLFGTGDLGGLRDLLEADRKALAAEREAREAVLADRGRRVREAVAALAADDRADGHADDDAVESADAGAVTVEELDALEAALAEASERAAAVAARASDAERQARHARDAARERLALLRRRDAARDALAALALVGDEVDAARARLDEAERAAEARGALDRWARADGGVTAADAALELAAAELPDDVEAARDAVVVAHDAAGDDAAVAQAAAELERAMPGLAIATARAAAAAEAASEALGAARAERERHPAERDRLVGAREAASTAAAGADAAEAAVATAQDRLAAARDVASLALEVGAARARATTALELARTETAHAAALQEARIAGIAGELAAGLADDEPCPVCGSTTHPAPAEPSPDATTAEAVAAAWERAEAAVAAAREADAALAEVDARRAARAAVAGDDDEQALAAALDDARAERERRRSAAVERARLQRELEAHDAATAALDERIVALEADAAQARERAAAVAAREADARERLDEALGGEDAATLVASSTARRDALQRWLDAEAGRRAALTEHAEAAAAGAAALDAHGFATREAAVEARLDASERTAMRARIRDHDAQEASARGVLAQPELADLGDEVPELEPLEAVLAEATAAQRAAARADAEADQRRRLALADAAAARSALAALGEGAAHAMALRALAGALRGENPRRQDIETYVLATRLAAIVDAANLRLAGMTGGRFSLLHDESTAYRGRASGLGLLALDAHTGKARTTESLSGGETFLASLALALGLADVVQAEAGGVSLETLFVDEGFGSLDADTLEQAMAVLDDLRAGGRSVGVISHVQQMQERIPARIRVVPAPGGGSRIVVAQEALPAAG